MECPTCHADIGIGSFDIGEVEPSQEPGILLQMYCICCRLLHEKIIKPEDF